MVATQKINETQKSIKVTTMKPFRCNLSSPVVKGFADVFEKVTLGCSKVYGYTTITTVYYILYIIYILFYFIIY